MYNLSFFLPRILLHTTNASFAYCCILVVWTVLYVLPLTVKRKISILVLYYLEYANWIRDGGESDNILRGPRHGIHVRG